MKPRLERLTRLVAPLRGAALVALAGMVATLGVAEPASAQSTRAERGSVWGATAQRGRVVNDVRIPGREHSRNLGRYETRYERVWVPGRTERRWIAPVYGWRCDYRGVRVRVITRAGYWDTIQHKGYYDKRSTRVWVPAYGGNGQGRQHRVSRVGRRYR